MQLHMLSQGYFSKQKRKEAEEFDQEVKLTGCETFKPPARSTATTYANSA